MGSNVRVHRIDGHIYIVHQCAVCGKTIERYKWLGDDYGYSLQLLLDNEELHNEKCEKQFYCLCPDCIKCGCGLWERHHQSIDEIELRFHGNTEQYSQVRRIAEDVVRKSAKLSERLKDA